MQSRRRSYLAQATEKIKRIETSILAKVNKTKGQSIKKIILFKPFTHSGACGVFFWMRCENEY
jgi:hypothetical protein